MFQGVKIFLLNILHRLQGLQHKKSQKKTFVQSNITKNHLLLLQKNDDNTQSS